jgi:hypothetical protein
LLNALIRAHRWNRWLNKGKYSNVNQIADEEGIRSPSCASRVLRLVLLAPDIQEKILHSTHPATLTLADFFKAISSSMGVAEGKVWFLIADKITLL